MINYENKLYKKRWLFSSKFESPKNIKNLKIGKYGKLRLHYIKEHKKGLYTALLMQNKLQEYLIEIDNSANNRFKILLIKFKESEYITEELKNANQLEWVGKMNSIKNRIDEIILNELIYN